jgi:hypothetical protein
MRIIDTSPDMLSAYSGDCFDIEKWKMYVDSCVSGLKDICLSDMNECTCTGFTWDKDFLPVLNMVPKDKTRLNEAIESFHKVTDDLNDKILAAFGRTVDVDIILYLGLCNGAGWVTEVNGKLSVLLGIEKIMELNWCGVDDMTGLIIHELGHVYHSEYGSFYLETDKSSEKFLWQLFTEGVAMVFEQEVVGNPDYYNRDSEWTEWCEKNIERIKESFSSDLISMTKENQRYFGDWVSLEGYGDTGYYLGTDFVRFLLEKDSFDKVISYSIEEVKAGFELYYKK